MLDRVEGDEEERRGNMTENIKGRGDIEIQHASDDGGFDFSKAAIEPVRPEPRYSLNMETLGRIERLAKAQFILSEKAPDINPAKFEKSDADTLRSIALSVFASSEIEGEGISTDYIEAFVTAHTEPGEMVDGDLRQRIQAHHDIIDSYFWALNSTFMCDFLAIHPFSDGNGRAARLLTTYLLERGGIIFPGYTRSIRLSWTAVRTITKPLMPHSVIGIVHKRT